MSKRTWTRHTILARLHELGWTLEEIAAREGVHRTLLSHALGKGSTRGEKIISKYVDVPAKELWPDRYPKSSHTKYDSKKHGPSRNQKYARTSDVEHAA